MLGGIRILQNLVNASSLQAREGAMAVPLQREPETFEQAMTSMGADITEAFNRGDVKTCTAYYVEDANLFLPDRPPIKGREAIEAVLQEYATAGAKLASVEPIEVGSSGDLGYYTGICQLEMPAEDGSTTQETVKFVSVFRLQTDGSWKAVIDSLIRDTAAESK